MVPWTVPLQQCSWCSRPRMNAEGAGAALCWLLHLWMFAFLSPPEEHSKVDSFLQAGGDLSHCVPNQLGKAFWQKDSNWASGIFGPCFYREPSGRRNVWRQLFPYRVPQFGVPEMHHDAAREAVDVLRCHLIFCWFQCQLLSIFVYIIPAGVAAQHEGVKPLNCHRVIVTPKKKVPLQAWGGLRIVEGKSAVAHVPSKRPAIGSTSKHTQPPRR